MAHQQPGKDVQAVAKVHNLPVSTKHCLEIGRFIRYKKVSYAKQFLQEVAAVKRAVPFRRFRHNIGHKAGMSTGRYPEKAARAFLKLIRGVEANAQVKGLDITHLKITKMIINKAGNVMTGARHGYGTKRTHMEIEVTQKGAAVKPAKPKQELSKNEEKKEEKKKEEKKQEVKMEETPIPAVAPTAAPGHHSSAPLSPPLSEASPAELLRRAQERAAQLNKKEKADKEVAQVDNLYEELQKKGTLRGASAGTSVRKGKP